MTEQEKQPERTEEQLKALKRQVSGVPASMYTEPPKKSEAEVKAAEAEAEKGRSAEHHREPKAATSKSKVSFIKRSRPRKR